MKNTHAACLLTALALSVQASCNRTASFDPVKSFSSLTDKFLSEQKAVADSKNSADPALKDTIAADSTIDVVKSESLVSPYIGTLRYQETMNVNGDNMTRSITDYTCNFAYQNNEWVLKEVSYKLEVRVYSDEAHYLSQIKAGTIDAAQFTKK